MAAEIATAAEPSPKAGTHSFLPQLPTVPRPAAQQPIVGWPGDSHLDAAGKLPKPLSETLNEGNHQWYLNKMSPVELEQLGQRSLLEHLRAQATVAQQKYGLECV